MIKFIKITADQYAGITPNADNFYLVGGEKLYLGTKELTTEADVKAAVALVNDSSKGNEKLYAEITKLEGDAETTGSIANLLAALKTTIEGVVVNGITAGNNGIVIGGTATNPTIGAKVSPKAGNSLSINTEAGEEGLYVNVPQGTDYTVTVISADGGSEDLYSKRYTIAQIATGLSATIDIPKDMVVESGEVVTNPQGQPAGTYLHLVLANAASSDIYINVSDLIEYVTSGSQAGDMVVIDIDAQHRVTATITDGTITKAKLDSSVQTTLNKADSALQASDITATGAEGTDGTITVKGNEVAVKGLGTAAYTASSAYDAAGSASAVQGQSGDAASAATVYGAKAYADSLAGNYDAAGEADAAEAAAKAYADGLLSWETYSAN